LKIQGRNPKRNLFLDTYVKIEESKLYDDWYFQRYVTAQSKISLGRILGTFTFNLPGGITIDASSMRDEGKEEIEQIKTKIDEENSPDWLFVYH
jgi:hypothetical protein